MNLSERSKLSLCQLFSLFQENQLVAQIRCLLRKHGLGTNRMEWGLEAVILPASNEQVGDVLDEVLRTKETLRYEISPRRKFDQRWNDLLLCLELDGYRLHFDEYGNETGSFVPTEPAIEGVEAVEDDLTAELRQSELPGVDDIVRIMESSVDAFRREDFNACLSSSRIALESLARSIAQQMQGSQPGEYDPSKWGAIVAYLRKSGFIDCREEAALVGVYGLMSRASHTPIGFSEMEFARLGRSLALGFCYFLIKQFNGQCHPHQ